MFSVSEEDRQLCGVEVAHVLSLSNRVAKEQTACDELKLMRKRLAEASLMKENDLPIFESSLFKILEAKDKT